MLYALAIVFIIIWLLGLATAYTLGGLIHLLLIIAVIAILVQLFGGKVEVGHLDD